MPKASKSGREPGCENGWSFPEFGGGKPFRAEKAAWGKNGRGAVRREGVCGRGPRRRWRVCAESLWGWPRGGIWRQWGGGTAQTVERSQAARSRGNLGSLHLEVRLRDETVLPSGCYQPLVQLLCREVKLGTQVRGPRGKVGGSRDSRPVLPVLLNLL